MKPYNGANPLHEHRRHRRAELRNVIAMAVPVVIATSSRALMDVADYIMITQLHSDEAQAAILPAQIVMWVYIIFGMGIVSLVNTFASQSLGKEQYRQCSAYAWQVLYIAALAGVIGCAARPILPALIAAIGHEEAVRVLELGYLRVVLLAVGPTIAATGLGWFFVGIHRPWVTTWSVIEANVVNIAVSIVLIFGLLGFPSMGIVGAAWGTFVGVSYRTIRLTLALVTPSMHRTFASRRTWRPSLGKLKDLLRVGLPCGLHWVSEVLVWAIFITVLVGTKFGTVHLVATNTAWQYLRISFMPMIGVGQALTALVGKSIGAGDPQRAIREARYAVLITFAFVGSLSLVYGIFGRDLIALFNDEPDIVRIGGNIMICAAVFQLFDALGITYESALRGAGDTVVPAIFFIISGWVIIVGGGWLVATTCPQLGSLGPWLSASGLIVITGIFLWWRWRGRAWMKINLLDDPPPPPPPSTEDAEAIALCSKD